MELEESLW